MSAFESASIHSQDDGSASRFREVYIKSPVRNPRNFLDIEPGDLVFKSHNRLVPPPVEDPIIQASPIITITSGDHSPSPRISITEPRPFPEEPAKPPPAKSSQVFRLRSPPKSPAPSPNLPNIGKKRGRNFIATLVSSPPRAGWSAQIADIFQDAHSSLQVTDRTNHISLRRISPSFRHRHWPAHADESPFRQPGEPLVNYLAAAGSKDVVESGPGVHPPSLPRPEPLHTPPNSRSNARDRVAISPSFRGYAQTLAALKESRQAADADPQRLENIGHLESPDRRQSASTDSSPSWTEDSIFIPTVRRRKAYSRPAVVSWLDYVSPDNSQDDDAGAQATESDRSQSTCSILNPSASPFSPCKHSRLQKNGSKLPLEGRFQSLSLRNGARVDSVIEPDRSFTREDVRLEPSNSAPRHEHQFSMPTRHLTPLPSRHLSDGLFRPKQRKTKTKRALAGKKRRASSQKNRQDPSPAETLPLVPGLFEFDPTLGSPKLPFPPLPERTFLRAEAGNSTSSGSTDELGPVKRLGPSPPLSPLSPSVKITRGRDHRHHQQRRPSYYDEDILTTHGADFKIGRFGRQP